MARWDHGYVTDVAYTTNAYQETMPSWLAACSVLLGYRPPDLTAPFRCLRRVLPSMTQSGFGRVTRRRRTPTSCRKIKISTSLESLGE